MQPDAEKQAQLEKEIGEEMLILRERCTKAESEVEQLRLQLQTKMSEAET